MEQRGEPGDVRQKLAGGFIIYAFLLFKQPRILRYIKRVTDRGGTRYFIEARSYPVSYPKTMYQAISIESQASFRRYFLSLSLSLFFYPRVSLARY